jgi:hypothetical protein
LAPRTQAATGESARQASDPPARPAIGDVEAATRAELAALGVSPATSAVAASALELARQLDNPRNSATAKSMCAGRLQEALDRLLELNPPQREDTPLDEITKRRANRLAAATG